MYKFLAKDIPQRYKYVPLNKNELFDEIKSGEEDSHQTTSQLHLRMQVRPYFSQISLTSYNIIFYF